MTRMGSETALAAFRESHFSSNGCSEHERFSYWHEVLCAHLSPCETEQFKPQKDFSFDLKRVSLGTASVVDFSFSRMRNLRDARCVRRMPDDDIFVAMLREGQGALLQDGRVAKPRMGDIVLYDSARPFDWRFEADSRQIIARLPRRAIASRMPNVSRLTARIIKGDSSLGSIIGHAISDMVRLEDAFQPDHKHRLGGAFIDLLAASIEADLDARHCSPANDDLVDKAKRFLLENIENSEIDLHHLTHHLGVSMRTLCRAFSAEGTSAIRWLWQQRLDLSYRLMAEGRVRSVSQVAMRCGFSNFAHFSRSFKKTFGVVPKSVLKGGSDPSGTIYDGLF